MFAIFQDDWHNVFQRKILRHNIEGVIHTTYVFIKFNAMGNMDTQDFGCAPYVEWMTNNDGSLQSHQDCTNLYNINFQTTI